MQRKRVEFKAWYVVVDNATPGKDQEQAWARSGRLRTPWNPANDGPPKSRSRGVAQLEAGNMGVGLISPWRSKSSNLSPTPHEQLNFPVRLPMGHHHWHHTSFFCWTDDCHNLSLLCRTPDHPSEVTPPKKIVPVAPSRLSGPCALLIRLPKDKETRLGT